MTTITKITKITAFTAAMLVINTAYAEPKPIPTQSIASIQAAADKLIARYNKYDIEPPRKVSEPKLNKPLPQCAVPLQAAWPKEPEADPNPYWKMEVKCARTVAGARVTNWLVRLPTDRRKTLVEQTKGLREIKDKAAELMDSYNRQHKTDWFVLEPNAKIMVPPCAVPLKATWEYGVSPIHSTWDINVICTKTVPDNIMNKWDVTVSTSRPRHSKYR